MNPIDERKVNPITEMTRIAQIVMGLESRGFKESYKSPKLENLIYDSEYCRINLVWGGWDYMGGNNMHVRYGRLHALNDAHTMIWNGEKCYCWHNYNLVLHFLDGRQPAEIVRKYYSHPITSQFYKDDIREKYPRNQPEWMAQMQVTIWQHYGNKFFELFDLRRPDLWEQYRQFLKEFYDIKGRDSDIFPPLDKVC